MTQHSRRAFLGFLTLVLVSAGTAPARTGENRRLYVAVPGIRNYLEYGGHGILVYDIDHGHQLLRRIKAAGLDPEGKPVNVKGTCASAVTKRLYISTILTLACYDLDTETVLWEKTYPGGCDRMALAPDGKIMYLPSFEKGHWHVVDALTGDVIKRFDVPGAGAHNTIYGLDGRRAYLAGLNSPLLTVAETSDHTVAKTVGPFSASIRPFTINGRQTLGFVNVNGLLGFEVGDLRTGEKLYRVEVAGYSQGPVKRHGCPSHGIGLTPDEREIWVTDGHNQCLHIFDATTLPPKQKESLKLRDEPGWVTFTRDGQYAYPSTGEVVETATRKVVATLKDEHGGPVQSEKMVEIDFDGPRPTHTGDQFGIGRQTGP